ncbi:MULTISPECIES: hypothetical protein [unclassified Isoptericola]|uniref:hypothetical protein n=1 Tax=unclassified Isoptericola TaxID=2623355 RepID=UPI00364C5518
MGAPAAYDDEALAAFFAALGLALGAGDLEDLTERFDLPALHVGQSASTVVTSPEQVLELHRERPAAAADAVAVVPEVRAVDEAGWGLLWVDVRWSYRDELAAERAADEVRYLLRRGRSTFAVCVVAPVD